MSSWRSALIPALLAASIAGAGSACAKPLMVGFYLPWDAASRASVVQHAASLDILAPMSGALDSPAGSLRWQEDPAKAPALLAAHGKPKVFPIVSNAHDNVWDTAAADGALTDAHAGQAFIDALVTAAKVHGYGGYILDFETLSAKATPAYAPFLAHLRAALKPLGGEVWVTASLAADPNMIRDLADAADAVVLMAYDQCWATSVPGPIAGQDWLEANLDGRVGPAPGVDPAKVIVALGAYGYDWPQGQTAAVLSAPDAARLAKTTGAAVARDALGTNPHFAYPAADGVAHQVWWLDAASFGKQRFAVQARHLRGVAVWRLGLEDPALWTAPAKPPILGQAAPPPPCASLPPRG